MKKTMKILMLMLIIVIVALTLTGCANSEKESTEGLAVYTADEDMTGYTKCEEIEGVEFYYPSNFLSIGKETQPVYMDPDIKGASVNIVSSDFPSAFTFEGYIDASILGIKDQMTISGEVNKEYINLNGVKAAKLDYVAIASGVTMKCTQVLIVKDNKAYVLTVGCLNDDAEAFQEKADKIIKSFK